mmetsp:Transcript_25421/g.54125  ORF Transcript_25421/g.54125 Transcript_25421/m.54125 type:complete len:207 (-) Transcript_25421:1297-1917(-)
MQYPAPQTIHYARGISDASRVVTYSAGGAAVIPFAKAAPAPRVQSTWLNTPCDSNPMASWDLSTLKSPPLPNPAPQLLRSSQYFFPLCDTPQPTATTTWLVYSHPFTDSSFTPRSFTAAAPAPWARLDPPVARQACRASRNPSSTCSGVASSTPGPRLGVSAYSRPCMHRRRPLDGLVRSVWMDCRSWSGPSMCTSITEGVWSRCK